MKRFLILAAVLSASVTHAYENELRDMALLEYNHLCQTSLTTADVESVDEVDADWDYSTQSVIFNNGGEAIITVTRDNERPGEYIYWLDEIYCD